MHTSKTIPRVALASVALLVLMLGFTITSKWTVKAQEPPAIASAQGWMHKDIGRGMRRAGDARTERAGIYSVTGAGVDIWNDADSFHYMYQSLNGDGQIVARVSRITGATNEWAKAGVMVRETLDDNSKNAMMLETPSHGLAFQWRSATSGDSYLTLASTKPAASYWVKLVRLGDWLAGYSSSDGVNWTLCGWEASDQLPAQIYVGLAVTSHDDQGLSVSTALFDQVSVGPADTSVAISPVVGTGDGLAGAYYPNRQLFGTPAMNRVDPVVNFDLNQNIYDRFPIYPDNQTDLENACNVVIGMPRAEEFSICWSGEIQAQFTEPYTLYVESDDGARVWLNEKLIIDDWVGHWAQEASATVNLVAGQRYLIRVEYYQYRHHAVAKLRWSSPSTPKCLVPQGQLYSQPTDTDGNGLPDIWETHYFGRLGVDPNGDPDNDGLSNLQEYLRHSDPTNPTTCGVPNEWWHGNIGWQAVGDASYSNGVFAVAGGGKDIWDDEDTFHYLYQPLNGNGQIVARVLEIQGNNNLAKAGVMVREALDDRSKNAMMFDMLGVGRGLTFQDRPVAGWNRYTEQPCDSIGLPLPYWVKLVRWNNWVGGYRSPDGINWTLQSWEGFRELAQQVYVGLAVTSHDDQRSMSTGLFDHVSVGPANPADVLSPVVGTGDGLMGNYYTGKYLSGLPVTNEVDAQVDFDWNHGGPTGQAIGAAFGVCWSGELQAQFTEPYTFYVNSKSLSWVRVWVNDQLMIDTWGKRLPDGEFSSGTINLTAGQRYLFRVEFYNNNDGQAAVHLFWSSPSTNKRLVPQCQLYSVMTDTDGNGLPDTWQMLYFGHLGVDPNADPDGDGLSNLQEYLHHTNPLESDTDGDGIPDGWEIAHGLNPTYNDAAEDPDQDGLNNLQEYMAGTDPNDPYSNGDGVLDSVEVGYLGTNAVSVTEVAAVNGARGRIILGRWQVNGADIYALDRRGAVEFKLTTKSADKFLLRLEGTQNQPGSPYTAFNLLLSVDGESLGHRTLTAGYGTNGTIECLMPFLVAGKHTVRVYWDDAISGSSLRIRQVKLLSIAGADANRNGIKDWVESALKAESGRDTNASLASYTSPVCLEGRDPYPSMMNLRIGTGRANVIPAQHNAGLRWYANVPLSAQTNTNVKISYQNGGRIEKCSLQWLPVNVLDAANLSIRTGDSLLLGATAGPQTSVRISVALGAQILTNFTTKANQPLPYLFANDGVYTVTATATSRYGSSQTGSTTVNVIGHNFPSNPACWMDRQRDWDLSSVATQVVLEADSRLSATQPATLSDNSRRLSLIADQNEPRYIVSRLGDGGPILDSAKADGLRLFATPDTYNQIAKTYSDGSRLVETIEVLSPVLPGVTVQVRIIVGGVTFDDGTTYKELSATDFDALGQHKLRFIMPEGVTTANCHRITIMQGAERVGDY